MPTRRPQSYADYRASTSILLPMVGYRHVPTWRKRTLFPDLARPEGERVAWRGYAASPSNIEEGEFKTGWARNHIQGHAPFITQSPLPLTPYAGVYHSEVRQRGLPQASGYRYSM